MWFISTTIGDTLHLFETQYIFKCASTQKRNIFEFHERSTWDDITFNSWRLVVKYRKKMRKRISWLNPYEIVWRNVHYKYRVTMVTMRLRPQGMACALGKFLRNLINNKLERFGWKMYFRQCPGLETLIFLTLKN